jgi:Domain of unknown function (DUF4936)
MTGPVLYVYYKVPLEAHAAWAHRVQQFQAALMAVWPGLQAELLQRPEASNGQETWMEIYRHAGGLGSGLQHAITQGAIEAGLPEPRHSEHFIPLR